MLNLIAKIATKRPWLLVVTMAAIAGTSLLFSPGLTDRLSGQGFESASSESTKAVDELADVTDTDVRGEFVALVQYGKPVDSPGGRKLVNKVARKFERDKDIASVESPFDRGATDKSLISKNGRSAVVLAYLKPDMSEGAAYKRLQDPIEAMPKVRLGGIEATMHTVTGTIEKDLRRAELIAFPLLFLIALFVFRGLIAALLPLLVGAITISVTFALIRMFDGFTDLSVFALNLTTGLGLGLAIDYSLLLVTRFREEIATGAEVSEAVRRTVATAGRTVAFSAVTVAAALGSLTIFPLKFLYSMGIGGATVALVSATVALTILPALLMLLGTRIDRFGIPRRSAEYSVRQWHRLATEVMKRPVAVALFTTALLVILILPATKIEFMSIDSTVLGKDESPRVVQKAIDNDFPRNGANARLWVLLRSDNFDAVDVGRDARKVKRRAADLQRDSAKLELASAQLRAGTIPGGPAQAQSEAGRIERKSAALQRRADRISSERRSVQRRADRLERFTDGIDGYGRRVAKVPEVESVGKTEVIGKGSWRIEVFTRDTLYSKSVQDAVKKIRALNAPTARKVGGSSAAFVDQHNAIANRTPLALALIAGVTFIALFMMTGSVILPIQTFIMNLLTLGATFGMLVWVFQQGHFESLLGYEGQGAMEMTQPVLLFAIAFGLATDYGVFLLSRIKELHDDGENDHDAVANGVARTGRVISSAAILFCVAMLCFSTSGIIFVKEMGIGAALAVAIDASIVRVMLVPALMTLLGKWNWWAPGPLRRFHGRFGFNEGPSAGRPLAVAGANGLHAYPVASASMSVLLPYANGKRQGDRAPLGGGTSLPFDWGVQHPERNGITTQQLVNPGEAAASKNGNGHLQASVNHRGESDQRKLLSGLIIGVAWKSRRSHPWRITLAAGRDKPLWPDA